MDNVKHTIEELEAVRAYRAKKQKAYRQRPEVREHEKQKRFERDLKHAKAEGLYNGT